MKPKNVPLDPDVVLANLHWVRGLARRLVTDPNVADDVSQEAWVAALRHQRPPDRPLRSWLGRVVRNCLRQARRREGVRIGHELAAAKEASLPSAADFVERAAAERSVVEAVMALDEPYRRTIFLRYFDGLTPSDIARRTNTPLATVKTRLRRALAELRERLDAEHGSDGRTWALALAPVISPPVHLGRVGPPWKEVLLVSTSLKVTLSIGATAVAAVLWIQLRAGEVAPPPESALAAAPLAELVAPDGSPEAAAAPVSARTEVAAETPKPDPSPPDERLVRARVIDVTNRPVGGVAIGLRSVSGTRMEEDRPQAIWREDLPTDADPVAISASDGRFTLTIDSYPGALVSVDERWETVQAPVPWASAEYTLVVAPRFSLAGRVRDETGATLSDARLIFVLPEGFKLDLDGTGEGYDNGWATTTDEEGAFALPRLPNVDGAVLRVRKSNYEPLELARTPWIDETLELTLTPLEDWIEGIVRGPHGLPVEGAHVALGYRGVQTSADGRFRLSPQGLTDATTIRAAAPGYLPASLEQSAHAGGWPPSVELTLREEALSLAGRVTDADGSSLAGLEVLLADPEAFYAEGDGPVQLESVLAGSPGWFVQTKTDASGRFKFAGLQRRDYSLKVVDSDAGLVLEVGPFRRGPDGAHDVEIMIPADALWPEVRGRVVTNSGEPVVDAGLVITSDKLIVRVPGTDRAFQLQAHGDRTKTGDDGTFVLHRVPRRGATLGCSGEGMASFKIELTPDTNADDLELVASREVFVRVRLAEPNGAEYFVLLDARGKRLPMRYDSSHGRMNNSFARLVDGRSPVISTADSAVELVIYKAGEELFRVPIHLLPGATNELEL